MKQLIIHRRVLLVLFLIMLLTLERRGFALSFSARTLSSLLSIQTDLSCYLYTLVKTYPHDTRAFSQGLLFHEGALYESTGLYGHSSLRKIDLNTGKILKIAPLSSPYFGEGLTL
ncbi:MAG: glutaminyl-peptide cyclotransferase, partial [Atribacterota bacterium]